MSSKYSGLLYRLYLSLFFALPTTIGELNANLLHNLGIRKYRKHVTLPDGCLTGKTVLITGANTGIGKETVRAVVGKGGKVIMACRDVSRGEKAKEDLVRDLGEDKRKLMSVVQLKLDDLKSVRRAAKQINSQITSLDVLINNAGVMMCPEWTTTDGFEYQLGTNHLGHFLLTLLLLNKLRKAPAGARIVNLSSIAHLRGNMHFDNFNLTGIYGPSEAYSRSKLANVLFTRELSKRLTGSDRICVYAVHPGIVATELMRHFSDNFKRIMAHLGKLMQINAVEGAQTTLYCAFDEAVANQSGFYYANCARMDKLPPHAIDSEDATKLWDLSLKLCDAVECTI